MCLKHAHLINILMSVPECILDKISLPSDKKSSQQGGLHCKMKNNVTIYRLSIDNFQRILF